MRVLLMARSIHNGHNVCTRLAQGNKLYSWEILSRDEQLSSIYRWYYHKAPYPTHQQSARMALTVAVRRASNLPNVDKTSKSDPYVVVAFRGTALHTYIKYWPWYLLSGAHMYRRRLQRAGKVERYISPPLHLFSSARRKAQDETYQGFPRTAVERSVQLRPWYAQPAYAWGPSRSNSVRPWTHWQAQVRYC